MKYILLILIAISSLVFIFKGEKDYSKEANRAAVIAKIGDYNTDYAILVDYSLHSGKKRLFLYNLKLGRIEKAYLVAHGEGYDSDKITPNFSNKVGSLTSSEGLGVLGSRAYSGWGIHVKYWIDGLEDTNSNMRRRVVVLHSWEGIPEYEVYPLTIQRSQGCFTVANSTMRELDKFIQKQHNKNIIIYTFK